MTIFAVGLVCSLGAGSLLQAFEWQRLDLLLLPWLTLAAMAVLRFRLKLHKAPEVLAAN